ncbi:hypothetical protein BY996DRAFT_6413787 [Phakopsora pachyrhizi]|nr:hypothetical protein BY996DRAFT_6427740 [Phakopsora pachyrhizi]KAI8454570.1 hypothetical protein BY996DRAFT_6413787 [Phakopsora pachyrhizi]
MEEKYQNIKNEISGNNSDLSSSGSGSNSNTESNNEKVNTGIDFKEAAHKLLKKDLEGFLELELANMAVECCSQQQSFAISYDLLGQTFCNVNQTWAMTFEKDFAHRGEREDQLHIHLAEQELAGVVKPKPDPKLKMPKMAATRGGGAYILLARLRTEEQRQNQISQGDASQN